MFLDVWRGKISHASFFVQDESVNSRLNTFKGMGLKMKTFQDTEELNVGFQDFLRGLVEENLNLLKKQNMEYKALKESRKNNASKIQNVLNKLSVEDKKLMNGDEMDSFYISSLEQPFLYTQGYLDCIKLLKFLSVI